MASLRQQKEAFVSGHSGTSELEVSALAAAPVVLLLLWRLAQHPATGGGGLFHRAAPGPARLAAEWVVLVLPLVAALLGLVRPGPLLGGAGVIVAALLATQHASERQHRSRTVQRHALPDLLRESLSSYRASLMLLTCIAILGVDFPAFPRRFAKAEAFGTGLMDAGVGSFVAASGLAPGLAAAARRAGGGGSARAKAAAAGSGRAWRKEAGRVAALLALGLARLAATTAADYQNHASEYGLHWNFFLTLAALRLLGLLTAPCTAAGGGAGAAAAGAALLAAHQWWLSAGDPAGISWVHSDERGPGLLSANKEGLASLAGYWALQLLGTAAGHACHAAAAGAAAAAVAPPAGVRRSSRLSMDGADNPVASPGAGLRIRTRVSAGSAAQRRRGQVRLLAQLAASTAVLWAAYWAAAALVQPVSRRACNAAYVLWMLALNVQSVALFVGADVLLPGGQPHLLASVNASMLLVFLGANLLTGAVNLSVNTLAMPDAASVVIVAAYTALLCASAVLLHERQQR
ncbi:hypothetical protein ABPG75_006526 [Micractinium tetrahymenae]